VLDAPVPIELVAATVNVYEVVVLKANPVTVIGLDVPVFENPPVELVTL